MLNAWTRAAEHSTTRTPLGGAWRGRFSRCGATLAYCIAPDNKLGQARQKNPTFTFAKLSARQKNPSTTRRRSCRFRTAWALAKHAPPLCSERRRRRSALRLPPPLSPSLWSLSLTQTPLGFGRAPRFRLGEGGDYRGGRGSTVAGYPTPTFSPALRAAHIRGGSYRFSRTAWHIEQPFAYRIGRFPISGGGGIIGGWGVPSRDFLRLAPPVPRSPPLCTAAAANRRHDAPPLCSALLCSARRDTTRRAAALYGMARHDTTRRKPTRRRSIWHRTPPRRTIDDAPHNRRAAPPLYLFSDAAIPPVC